MLATQVISEVQRLGVSITVDDPGKNLVIEPGSLLTPEMIDELRQHKEDILSILRRREEAQQDTSAYHGLGGELRRIRDEKRAEKNAVIAVMPPESLPRGGRDRLVHRDTEKSRFFKGDWRQTWPRDYKVYRGGGS